MKNGNQQTPATILVLGMHRSGTSMIARLANLCGAYIAEPSQIMEASPANPAGYWEPEQLVAVNRAILKQMGCSWCAPPVQGVAGSSEELDRRIVRDMKRFLSSGVPQDQPRVLKDPRMSILLPLWRDLIRRPVALIVWRNPVDVAKSVEARDGFPASVSYALWEQYTRSAIEVSDGMPRMLVSFDRFLEEPKPSIETLVEFLVEHAGTKREQVDVEQLIGVTALDIVHHRSSLSMFCEDPSSSGSQRELLKRLQACEPRAESVNLDFDVEPVSLGRKEVYGIAGQLDGMKQQLERSARGAEKYRASYWLLRKLGLRSFARWVYKRSGAGEADSSKDR